MSLKKIITIPDPILREKSKDIVHFDNKTKNSWMICWIQCMQRQE